MSCLVNMDQLNLASNKIIRVPSLDGMVNLKRLALYMNKISQMADLKTQSKLEKLELYQNIMSQLPLCCAMFASPPPPHSPHRPPPSPHPCMPNLDDLRISKNADIVALPPFFAGFPRLVEFYAFNCKIEELPADLARCKVLTKIFVAGNRLSIIPDGVARSAVRCSPLPSVFLRALFSLPVRCWLR